MKTIVEESRLYAESKANPMFRSLEVSIAEKAFKAGVEFAQRWISVEDELPEITTINNHNAVNVKFKTIYGDERVCTATLESFSQHCGENSPMNDVWYVYPSGGHVLRNVTHWRPIEIK